MFSLLLLLAFQFFSESTVAAESTYLNLTAISAANGASTLECWQLTTPFIVPTEPGIAGSAALPLGNVTSAIYAVLPPHFDGGLHVAPRVQYVAAISGVGHATLPDSDQEAYFRSGYGSSGLIIAADTAAVSEKGHITRYPSDKETNLLAIPSAGGKVPDHIVLHDGPCDCDRKKNGKDDGYGG
ncbi:MAG: hypothetical protein M1816_003738 [Peltula sp. TS41687]|nr:MAG: hypothetical protein M1816_003738 [Peltula sp. TS41687]